jgi:hypothetical protein
LVVETVGAADMFRIAWIGFAEWMPWKVAELGFILPPTAHASKAARARRRVAFTSATTITKEEPSSNIFMRFFAFCAALLARWLAFSVLCAWCLCAVVMQLTFFQVPHGHQAITVGAHIVDER